MTKGRPYSEYGTISPDGEFLFRTLPIPPEVLARGEASFWAKVRRGSADECWPWTAYIHAYRDRRKGTS